MQSIRTVVVEDDPMVMDVNCQYIEDVGGFTIVGRAETGFAALKMVEDLVPDLVVLDVFLPDLDGLATLQEIRRRHLPADVIVVTAARDVDSIREAFRYGAVDYVVKPFRFERIKNALENYRSLRDKFRGKASLEQEDIDAIGPAKMRGISILPKGLTEVTMKQVLLFLSKDKQRGFSAEEVAEGVGLSRVTARRYLDYLEKTNQIRLEVQYGSVGRPVNRYFWH